VRTPNVVTVYLEKGWELPGEPNSLEGLQALVDVLSAENEQGSSLLDNYGEGNHRDAFEERVNQVVRGITRGVYENEEHLALDFQTLFDVVISFARPGWCVSLTLLSNGRLGYAHRPMSTEETLLFLLKAEGVDETHRHLIDFIDLHESAEQFRHFFFGPETY